MLVHEINLCFRRSRDQPIPSKVQTVVSFYTWWLLNQSLLP